MNIYSAEQATLLRRTIELIPNYPRFVTWYTAVRDAGGDPHRFQMGNLPADFPLTESDSCSLVCFASTRDRQRALAMVAEGEEELERRLRGERKKYRYGPEYVSGLEFGHAVDRPVRARRTKDAVRT